MLEFNLYRCSFLGFFSFFLFFSSQHWKCLRVEARIWKIIFRYIVFLMDYPPTITAHVNITCVHSMYVDKCTSEATAFCPWKKNNETCWNSLPNKRYSWIECGELFLNYICKLNGGTDAVACLPAFRQKFDGTHDTYGHHFTPDWFFAPCLTMYILKWL